MKNRKDSSWTQRVLAVAGCGFLMLAAGCVEERVLQDEPAPDEPHGLTSGGTASQPLYVATSKLWGLSIPTCWENPTTANAQGRQWTLDAVADSWERTTGVDFQGWGACPASFSGLRIFINDEGPHTKGLGTTLNGVSNGMVLNFTFNNWGTSCQSSREYCIRTIAVHEFGHALGFAHEQNRPDTPSWCDEEQGSDGDTTVGAWDLDSVMNYCNPVWSGDGNLSAGDIDGAQRYYGARTSYVVAGDFNGDGRSDTFTYAPGSGEGWVALAGPFGTFSSVCPGVSGFSGYDLLDPRDRGLAFDYDNDGRDDLFLYRPGKGTAYVFRSNGDGTFTAVYAAKGIGGFDLLSPGDQALAFDYNNDGRDDLFLYRPGAGEAYVARSNGDGTFTNAYGARGIGGFDLLSPADRVLVTDYNGDGRDDLFLYRPGGGAAYMARSNGDGTFTNVHGAIGIGGYDLLNPADRVLVTDYNGDSRDDLFLYRPGGGAAYVVRSNGDGTFTTAYGSGQGIGGYDLLNPRDRATVFDYNNDGRDDLFLYRPGSGVAYVVRSNGDGSFTTASSGSGLAGVDLLGAHDTAVALDANGDHNEDLLIVRPAYRAGRVAIFGTNGASEGGFCMSGCDVSCPL